MESTQRSYAKFGPPECVMLYFPIIKTHYPSWFPVVGGEEFEFFSPIFNIAEWKRGLDPDLKRLVNDDNNCNDKNDMAEFHEMNLSGKYKSFMAAGSRCKL